MQRGGEQWRLKEEVVEERQEEVESERFIDIYIYLYQRTVIVVAVIEAVIGAGRESSTASAVKRREGQ